MTGLQPGTPVRSSVRPEPPSSGVDRVLARLRTAGPVPLALLALGLFVLAGSAVWVAQGPGRVASWWPAAGIGVLAVLWAPRTRRPAVLLVVLLATGLANVVFGRPPATTVGFALGNAAEAAVVAAVLLSGRARATLETLDDVVRLILATVAGAATAGTVAGVTAAVTGYGDLLPSALTVAASHAASVMVIVPVGLTVRVAARRPWPELIVQGVALVVVAAVVFGPARDLPLTFAPIPLLVWGALRFSPRVMAVEVLLLAVVVTSLSALDGSVVDRGGVEPARTALVVQSYLLTVALVTLPLVLSVHLRRTTAEGLAVSERLFRQGFSESLIGMALLRRCRGGAPLDTEGHEVGALHIVEVNPVAARLLDEEPHRLVGQCWTSFVEEPDRGLVLEVVEALRRGRVPGWRGEVAVRTGQRTRWLEVALSPLSPTVGAGMFVAQMVDVTARREAEERLTAQALQDALTGLANRLLLKDRVGLALDTAEDEESVTLLFCDLDDFKRVNDSAGHTVGDHVLVEIAHRLRSLLTPGDLAARLGGDEFVVLRAHRTSAADALRLADRIVEEVGRPIAVEGKQPVTVGVSVGVVQGGPGQDADELLRDADAAMYAAKAEGKRRAVLYSEEHREGALRSVRLEAELRRAIAAGELEVYLQPVVDLRTAEVVAAEALVRWHHPDRGVLPPGEWLDVAEDSGLMPEIGEWVLRRSCELAVDWPATARAGAPLVHVNVSARQLEVPGFVDVVRRVLAETGLPPRRLVLEVTETFLDEISEALIDDLAALRAAGIGLAADDYGTGYSPLTRITELPLSMIKIDQRFVGDMLEDVRSRAIVTTLVRLGYALGLDVVAEGVETAAQATEVGRLGCVHAQGYLWSRPVPGEQFLSPGESRPV